MSKTIAGGCAGDIGSSLGAFTVAAVFVGAAVVTGGVGLTILAAGALSAGFWENAKAFASCYGSGWN